MKNVEVMKKVVLNSGEDYCPECLGGKIHFKCDNGFYIDQECPKCYGEGKLDWIEMATGKKKINKIRINSMYGMVAIRNPSTLSVLNLNVLA